MKRMFFPFSSFPFFRVFPWGFVGFLSPCCCPFFLLARRGFVSLCFLGVYGLGDCFCRAFLPFFLSFWWGSLSPSVFDANRIRFSFSLSLCSNFPLFSVFFFRDVVVGFGLGVFFRFVSFWRFPFLPLGNFFFFLLFSFSFLSPKSWSPHEFCGLFLPFSFLRRVFLVAYGSFVCFSLLFLVLGLCLEVFSFLFFFVSAFPSFFALGRALFFLFLGVVFRGGLFVC